MSEPIITNEFPKKPRETRWVTISFKDRLDAEGDTPAAMTPIELDAIPTGITVAAQSFNPTTCILQLLVSGGQDKSDYPLTMWINTTRGQRLQHDIVIKVRERGR